MPRVFAFVPVGGRRFIDHETGTASAVVRIGFTKSTKDLVRLFSGLNEPSRILLDLNVPDGRKSFDNLQSIMRGHECYGVGRRFALFDDFSDCRLGYNFVKTQFTVEELDRRFFHIRWWFTLTDERRRQIVRNENRFAADSESDEEQPPVEQEGEVQPEDLVQPGEAIVSVQEGEQVQMRIMSSAQAAAILCGVPGSIEQVLQN